MALVLDGDNGIVGVLATNADGDVIIDTNTFFVDAVTNRVGIGSITPENTLHVVSGDDQQILVQNSASGDASIKFNRSGQTFFIGIESSDNSFRISDGAVGLGTDDRLVIDSSGNVGIGTASPGATLDIRGSGNFRNTNGLLFFTDNNTAGATNVNGAFIGMAHNAGYHVTSGDGGFGSAANSLVIGNYHTGGGDIILATTNSGPYPSGRVIIKENGHMGIGIDNPQYQLDITRSSGNTDVARIKGNTGNAFIRFQDNDNSSDFTLGSDDNGPTGSGSFVIYDRNASSYRWRLDSAGRVTMPYQPCAFAFKSDFGNSTSDSGAGALNAVGTNVGGHFNTSTGRFTAPVAGSYHVCWTMMNNQGNTGTAVCVLRINDVGYKYFHVENSHPQGQSDQAIVTLAANDWLDISLSHYHWNGGTQFKYPSMSVFLIG